MSDVAKRKMTPVQFPGNDREYIVDQLFWGEDDSHWEKTPGTGCEQLEQGHGYARTYTWRAISVGAFLTWRGNIEADLVGIRRVRVRAQVAVTDRVTLRAEVDGEWVTLVEAHPGNDDYDEYEGEVSGRRLSGVEVVFSSGQTGPVVSSVMWVMVVKAGTPTPIATPDSGWRGFLRDNSDGVVPEPLIGVFFDTAELKALREQVHAADFAPAWAEQVQNAEAFALVDPEATANPVIPYARKQYGRPEVPEQSPAASVAAMAFVGLIETRDDLRRTAARWALTWSRCERWVQYGIENLRGVPLSHGRFAQADITTVVSQVLDWCGGVLTEAGRDELARAIHDLGILDIDGIMQPGSYVWHMNQGIVFESGRFHGAMAVRKWYPDEHERRRKDAEGMLETCLTTSFHDDGAGTEGSAYWNYTMTLAVPLIAAVARSTGCSVSDITPTNVAASGHWAWLNQRTDSDALRFLPHADSSYDRMAAPRVAAFLAGPLGQSEWLAEALAGRERPDSHAAKPTADPLYLRYLRDITGTQNAPVAAPPTLTVFPRAGQVDVRPPTPGAGIRLYFLSGSRTGHCHDDKNSFMLEAFGRTLLLDRGTPVYTHPATEICKRTEAHNAVVPDGLSQSVAVGAGGAVLLRADEEDGRVHIESDATGCWPGLAVRASRRLTLVRPATLLVEDDTEWTRPTSTWQCWQAPVPWQRRDDGWMIVVDGVELLLQVLSTGDFEMEAAPFSLDGLLRPVHRLVIRTPRDTRSCLRTLFRVRRAGDEWSPMPEDMRRV